MRRDARMQGNEDINEKDQLLREGQQGQEDSLEIRNRNSTPTTTFLILGTRILCSGGDL